MDRDVDLLILGAGPFGLGMARYAAAHGIGYLAVGKPMSFWRQHMPAGMLLRSGVDWHLDPLDELTMERYVEEESVAPAALRPLSLQAYLGYCEWFRRRIDLQLRNELVGSLERGDDGRLVATLRDGSVIRARNVLLALGFQSFPHVPDELAAMLPPGSFTHTRDCVNLHALSGSRCLIVGGRQSAFEWAALLAEAGAATVHVVHRHETPRFAPSDWSFVERMLAQTEAHMGWFRRLPEAERDAVVQRFREEGRLKLEPWLARRVETPRIRLWPRTRLTRCEPAALGGMTAELATEEPPGVATEIIDRVILATGYRVDMSRLQLLGDTIRAAMPLVEGFPQLDETFQATVPGLYVTSMPATRDFGPFLAFTVSVRATTRIIGAAIRERLTSDRSATA